MSGELARLKEHREAILLAEIGALLHDVGKLSSQFIDQMSLQPSSASSNFEHESAVEKVPNFVDEKFLNALKDRKLGKLMKWSQIQANEQLGCVLDLIVHHDKSGHSALLVRLLNRCDGADSGADKGTTRAQGLPSQAKQPLDATHIATAFGYEPLRLDKNKLDTQRQELTDFIGKKLNKKNLAASRSEILQKVVEVYKDALGETRRSANDVTLWDHSFSVATLYKAVLAALALGVSPNLDCLSWRILRVNFDVLALYAKAIKIADLFGYRDAVEQACKSVQRLIEEEYPLGNEVYRDTTGIYFTFPDLDLPTDLAHEIRRRVEEVEPKLAPRIDVTQGKDTTATEQQLKGILAKARTEAHKTLAQPFDTQNLNAWWQQQWETVGQGQWEVCPVCRLRPCRESDEACEHCLGRRQSRIQTWFENPSQTIWMDEIADESGRVALLVAKFGLDDWLSGHLVQTLLVKADKDNPDGCVPKNPSPARLRRVWETTQRFWQATAESLLAQLPQRTRWELKLQPVPTVSDLPDKTVCDGTINGKPLSVYRHGDTFLTISNILEKPVGRLSISWEADGKQRRGTFEVQDARLPEGKVSVFRCYSPYLTLLASPDQFLVLVPAREALDLARKISEAYAQEFGKVRNRLPLFLGLIFFPRKTPLAAVMEAARQMLDGAKFTEQTWKVTHCTNGIVTFCNGVEWQVPTMMGDDTTKDIWYPYFFFSGIPDQRKFSFQFKPEQVQDEKYKKYKERWLVHVGDLREYDRVYVTPSRFDFEFLDTAGRRFEVFYAQDGRRRAPAKRNRPYLLDDLERFHKLWDWLKKGLSTAQIKQLDELIEAKREAWKQDTGLEPDRYDQTFKEFVCNALQNAGWKKGQKPDDQQMEALYRAALTGELHDLLELYMEILKEKPEADQQGGGK